MCERRVTSEGSRASGWMLWWAVVGLAAGAWFVFTVAAAPRKEAASRELTDAERGRAMEACLLLGWPTIPEAVRECAKIREWRAVDDVDRVLMWRITARTGTLNP